jgi:Mlc titration factor MtfA (ptsG expression regulator)
MLPVLQRIHSFITQKNKKEETLRAYTSILKENFNYFNELSEEQKNRFVDRVYRYKRSKNFHLVEQEENPAIEVMISAAAVQLTFGMEDYKMNFFDDIYVTKDAYTYGLSNVPWAGHVNSRGIYISWNHFTQGYKYRNDRYNVGLHEMAHALEYEFQYGDSASDEVLRQKFESVMRQVEGVLFHEGWRPANLFTAEGLQNRHECWAESIELFFENPWELKQHYPDVYEGIMQLLNQNPLKSSS